MALTVLKGLSAALSSVALGSAPISTQVVLAGSRLAFSRRATAASVTISEKASLREEAVKKSVFALRPTRCWSRQ